MKRHHFTSLQHNKIIIAKRGGKAFAVFTGSTNYSLRGLYIQANNALLFVDNDIAGWYADDFETAFPKRDEKFRTATFTNAKIAGQWFENRRKRGNIASATPRTKMPSFRCNRSRMPSPLPRFPCFMLLPSAGPGKTGPADLALNKIDYKKLLVMGVADKPGKKKSTAKLTEVQLPGRGPQALPPGVLSGQLPQPFKAEWSGGSGVRLHHKFVICDFNTDNPVAFTGSSNSAAGGEEHNGDNLIEINDPKVVTAYAVEALRIFDHYDFRNRMKRAKKQPAAYDLAEPPTGKTPAWWAPFFDSGDYKSRDRTLFSS